MTADSTGLNTCSQVVDIVQAIVTIIAIVLGGWWSYMIFMRTRQKYPRANVKHEIEYYPITDNKILLRVRIDVSNIGDVLLSLISGKIRLQQVLPPVNHVLDSIQEDNDPVNQGEIEVQWPLLCERELIEKGKQIEVEPKESDEITCDFVIDDDVKTIQVYSYLKNAKKRRRNIGWGKTTIYNLKGRRDSNE